MGAAELLPGLRGQGRLTGLRPVDLWYDESGMSSTEYALLLGLIACGSLVAFGNLSTQVRGIAIEGSRTMQRASGISCFRS